MDSTYSLATLALSTATLSIMLPGSGMTVEGRLGNLSLTDDFQNTTSGQGSDKILSIEGDNFAEVRYQTFDPASGSFAGVNSEVSLRSAAVKVHFLERPLQRLYRLLSRFAHLKVLYDAATQVAVQRASEITRMKFYVEVQSPIIVFPCGPDPKDGTLVLKLGQFKGSNQYSNNVDSIEISLTGTHLESKSHIDQYVSVLNIIDDVAVDVRIEQLVEVENITAAATPASKVCTQVLPAKTCDEQRSGFYILVRYKSRLDKAAICSSVGCCQFCAQGVCLPTGCKRRNKSSTSGSA